MLEPMGLPKDVSVIAWGISLERPTMIYYGIDKITTLFGHERNFNHTRDSQISLYFDKEGKKEKIATAFQANEMPCSPETDELLNELESILKNTAWVAGDKLTSADKEALEMLEYPPNPDSHPHTFAWYTMANRFTPAIRNSWSQAPAGFKGNKGKQEAKPQNVGKKESQPKKGT